MRRFFPHFRIAWPTILSGSVVFSLVLVCVTCLCAAGALAGDETAQKIQGPRGGCPDLIDLIKNLTPVVVNISIERHMLQNSSTEPPPLFRSRPGYFDERGKGRDRFQADSLGSGFFCDTAGHIVTNGHVVEGASKILVTLSTGSVESAKVVAVHPKVDLALLKINPPYALQKAKIGDSSKSPSGRMGLGCRKPLWSRKNRDRGHCERQRAIYRPRT